jgi:hypothetical protein
VSQNEYFKGPKNEHTVDDFHNIWLPFVEKIVNKVFACFYEITSENPSNNPLQEACTCFLKAASDSENCPESLL